MDTYKGRKNDIWKYLLGIGAGLGLGYVAYKKFFSTSKAFEDINSLSRHDANLRFQLLSNIKYNIYLKIVNPNEKKTFESMKKSSVHGVVEIEFDIADIQNNITLEFSGVLLGISKANSDEQVKYFYDSVNHKIMIYKQSLTKGTNKFIFNFCNRECNKGIIFNDGVNFIDNIFICIHSFSG